MNDPHMHGRGMLEVVDHYDYGPVVLPNSPLRFHGADKVPTRVSRASGSTTTRSMAAGLAWPPTKSTGCAWREQSDMEDATESAPNGRVLLEMRGNVAVMTLNDPSVLNAFGFKLRQDMTWALDQVEAGGARCLMITGAGRAFCSGANLNDPDRPPRDARPRRAARSKAICKPGTTRPSSGCAICPCRS